MPEQHQWRTSGLVRLTRPQMIGTLSGLMLTMLLAALDQTIVGTAEPNIIASLSGFDRYPWVATAYLLCSTVSVPIFAKLSDIYGRKWFLLSGATGFVLASALCGAAGEFTFGGLDGMNQLILFRALQGICGGMMMGLTFTILGDIFSPAERGRYQGVFSGAWGVASVFGPTLGGWLTDQISWRATFYVNLPVGAVAIAALYLRFPYWRPHDVKRRIDWAGTATLIGCVVPLLLAMTWVTEYGWSSPYVEAPLALSAVMLAAFLYAESRAVEPLIPLTLFRNPIIAMCSTGVFIVGVAMFGMIIYLPLYMQGVLGVSATKSGNLLTPLLLGVVVGTFLCGQATLRLRSYRKPQLVGSVLVALGTILFARVDGTARPLELIAAMISAGLGMGFLLPAYTIAVQNAAPHKHMGIATASSTFFRSIGSTVGVALFGSLLLTNYHHAFDAAAPHGVPREAMTAFSNPLLLPQMRPSLEQTFSHYENGPALLQDLYGRTGVALLGGIREIFLISAILMVALLVLNAFVKDVPLRHGPVQSSDPS
ncbi:MAG TPA: MDR family MFS transporter [Terriglobia bacterium]|nr:MDR family MFS transporter [Terriglobia bacterium]